MIAKLVSEEWKKLSPEERNAYDELARQDKARYNMEKKLYTGPWKIAASKRTPKDPTAPKRPMSAFLSFSRSKRVSVREENPNLDNIEVSRLLAKMWKEAPESERRIFIEEELGLRQLYKLAIAEWRAKNDVNVSAQRQQREDAARKRMETMQSYSETRDRESLSAKMPVKEAPMSDPTVAVAPPHYAVSSMYANGGYPVGSYYDGYSYPPYDGGYADVWMAQAAAGASAGGAAANVYGAHQYESAVAYGGAYGYPYEAAHQQQDRTRPSYESPAAYGKYTCVLSCRVNIDRSHTGSCILFHTFDFKTADLISAYAAALPNSGTLFSAHYGGGATQQREPYGNRSSYSQASYPSGGSDKYPPSSFQY